jgi:2-methylcitrate dehydratase
MTLAEDLAEYSYSLSYNDLPSETVTETKKRILDALGCAIAGLNVEPALIAREYAMNITSKSNIAATLWGSEKKTAIPLASFVNSIVVRYFDYNDTYLSKEPAHPSDNIPSCIAAAEASKTNGKALITAVALAYEVQCRLADAADLRHRGWDHVCYGLVSVALAVGKLLGLTKKQLVQAINLSLNSHITMRQVRSGELSMWKGCSFAESARNAVFSTLLAKNGMTGPSPIFEGDMGFWKQVSGSFDLDIKTFGNRKNRFKINDTSIKYFPAEYHSQSAIWAALKLRDEIGNISDIENVEIASQEAGFTILGNDTSKWNPETKETADHSLPYIVARTLWDGNINNDTYTKKKFRDRGILNFMKKITVINDQEITKMYPKRVANRITLKLKSGKILSEQVNDPKGHPYNPMTEIEIERKFNTLAKSMLNQSKRKALINAVLSLETLKDMNKLVNLLSL